MSARRLAVAIFGLILSTTGAQAQTRPGAAATAADLSRSLEATAALVGPAVVEIFTTSYAPGEGLVPRTADLVTTERATGSGVIVDSQGYVVTNAHVVRGAHRLRVEVPVPAAGRSGDLVLALDGKPMENGRQFQVSLYRHGVGDAITLDVLREDQALKIPVSIVERHDPLGTLSASIDPRQNLVPRLGVLGVKVDERIAAMLPMVRTQSGVLIVSTVPGAIDSRDGGLSPGDIVYAVNRRRVAGLEELRAVLDGLKPDDPVVLQLERDGELLYLAFTIE